MMNRGNFFKTLLGGIVGVIVGPTALEKIIKVFPVQKATAISSFDPALIAIVRKTMTSLSAFNICNTDPQFPLHVPANGSKQFYIDYSYNPLYKT